MLPSPDILNDYEHGKFVLSNLAAKRAKQLSEGAPALVQVASSHPLTIALAEIAAGRIKPILSSAGDVLETTAEVAVLIDETGILLPALDETEAAMVTAVGDEDSDSDVDADGEDTLSLSSLMDDDEEAAPIAGEDVPLSLTEIAEQEAGESDEETEEE